MNYQEKMVRTASEDETKKLLAEYGAKMTQFELGLIVSKNAFEQWVVRCGAAAGMKGYSPLELLVLHMIEYNGRPKRIADICFGLKVEDTHLVSYALKKLAKAELVESRKDGKETFFSNTASGSTIVKNYQEVRQKYLIRSLTMFSDKELDLEQLASVLRTLSGIYEQAARNVETST